MSKRCTLTQAIGILAPLSPTKAANRLTQGVHDKDCRLYCNGKKVPYNIASRLRVMVQFENDGSWVARIENVAYAAGGVQPATVWELEVDEVRALRENDRASLAPPPRRRGPVVTHDWFSICGEIARRCIDPKTGRVRVPKKGSSLVRDMRKWCEDQGWAEPARSEMSEAVRRVCAALKPAEK
jgi:hypothetical protein